MSADYYDEHFNLGEQSMTNVKSREDMLRKLVPKILGIICDKGQKLQGLPGRSVRLGEQLELSGSRVDASRIMLSVYSPVRSKTLKVFSAHVTDLPSAGDPTFYRYLDGCVGLMSWRRGEWEDAILADAAEVRSPSEALSNDLPRAEAYEKKPGEG